MPQIEAIEAAVARKMGGEAVVHAAVRSQADLARLVGQGLPLGVLEEMKRHAGFSDAELSRILPPRTLQHRRARRSGLTVQESDKAVRLLRVQTLAEQALGSPEKAHRWLRRPLSALDGDSPLRMAETEAGARVVETILHGIHWGAAA